MGDSPKAIVLGGGVAGLAVSVRLRRLGLHVTLLEKNAHVGGKLNEFKAQGYRFDIGPSLFTLPHLVDELFTLWGEKASDHFRYFELPEICNYFFPDGRTLTTCREAHLLDQRIHETFGEESGRVRAFLNYAAELWRLTAPLFIEGDYRHLSTLFKNILHIPYSALFRAGFFTTMAQKTRHFFRTTHVQQLFNRYATYNGSDPYRAPGTLCVIPHVEYGYGAWLPEGGMVAIPRTIEALARRKGVEIQTGTLAQAVSQKGKQWQVHTPECTYEADVVVVAIDVATFFTKIFPRPSISKRLIRQERSSSAFVFNWGIRHTDERLGVHNIFFSSDYAREFLQLKEGRLPDDPTVYVFISSKVIPEDAPSGCENWFVMINAPPNYPTSPEIFQQAQELVEKKINRILGYRPSQLAEVEFHLSPATLSSLYGTWDGALYGAASNSVLSAFWRPPNASRLFPGLFFCGGTVHPGGGIPLCLYSAKLTANAVARYLR
ncbi:MAG: phytoene desaturase family protein [Flavobacteriales bacterium]|nr:phytoene desaturase family protein [Flavobacteriales bacterium]MDW8410970.1 phytoene desaturase family protein [Flavobacteriales bacterium]